ncbi:MAG: MMPL family transporter [Tannerella sp.]|jgi:predicted exporter|nr:MMPL family transporter [Tannerella sp.]
MIALYHFFERHKLLFYGLLTLSSLLFVYLGSRVEYEEDITKLLPSAQTGTSEKLVFENLKVKDKIFLLFVPRAGTADAGVLAERCDAFVEGLLQKDSATHYIHDVLYRIDDELIQTSMAYLFDHAPVFMDTTLYPRMEALLTREAIERQMAASFDLMISPSGMAFREMIRRDPVGLRSLFTDDGAALSRGFGGNYRLVYRHFFSPDSSMAVAFLSPDFNAFDSKSGTWLVELIEEEIDAFCAENPDVEVMFHGVPVQSVFNSRRIKQDLALTLGVSLLVSCFIIGLCFRNRRTLPILLSPVLYGTFFALSGVYLIKGGMSLLAVGIGAIVLGVALSYCLHFLTHYKYVGDPVRILREQSVPIILCCLTTIGAFTGLLFTRSELLRDFGLFASLALIGTTLFCLIFLPHFFKPRRRQHLDRVFALVDRINAFPFDRQIGLIVLLVVFCGFCFYASRWVTFDTNLRNIGYHEPDVVRSMQLLAAKTTQGNASIYYAVASPELDSALIAHRQMAATLDSLQAEGLLTDYSKTTLLLLPENEQQIRIRRWRDFWTPERISRTRMYVTNAARTQGFKPETFDPFFEMLAVDDRPVSICDEGILPGELMSNMVEYTDGIYLVYTSVQMPPDKMNAVSGVIAARPHWLVIDPFYYTSDMVRILNDDFNTTLGVSSVFVFAILLLAFRKWSRAILAFIPMGLSWYVVLGVMGMTGHAFNLINIVISTFIFGVGVDYSIFVMDGLVAGSRYNDKQLLTYHKTAIFFSAVVLMVSITPLIFATHPAIRSVGFATLVGMGSTVLITYTLPPFLFRILRRKTSGHIRRRR